ncbi:carbon-nitrogen hydrolase family protein [Acidiluteibacter ferrifornacis]|uniref:Carbon-nitrogen hydrolase family protein n=1 Tax=Acidiluteibacter ferrifornacis TaxID=2692424 RepID=A0A6N9NLP3_9FLAO|nr:carbon-nitrogen hydrolase family protein [Acidiluteibacter ferrifornacis]MBR9831820.1 carbon-nitrogen hydrolase family protein [bacterium]NBG66160.1 carbon-nitrogen hydrolase family protein [Acidiluteibacter ferrifornacis]
MSDRKVNVAMAQLLVEGGEVNRNFERAFNFVKQASQQDCKLIVLPETIDFAWTHPRSKTESEPIPGAYSDQFCQMAKEFNIYICVGLTEKINDNKRFNTALLIDSEGKIVIKYHKINLLSVEHDYYEVGNTLNVVSTPFGKVGLNICADNYPDALHIGHTLARMGAEIILSPSSWTVDHFISEDTDPYAEKWVKPLNDLASKYNIVIISTTSVGYIVGGPYEGKKMVGCSLAVNKDGIISKGIFNEFAGELIVQQIEIPEQQLKGTDFAKL